MVIIRIKLFSFVPSFDKHMLILIDWYDISSWDVSFEIFLREGSIG